MKIIAITGFNSLIGREFYKKYKKKYKIIKYRKDINNHLLINEFIKSIRAAGLNTFQDISVALNNRGIKTYNDGAWYPTTVKNIIERVGA